MVDFKQYKLSATASDKTTTMKSGAKADSTVENTLEWPQGQLAHCCILFKDVDAHKAVYLNVTANSESRSSKSEVFGRTDSPDSIKINHFTTEFTETDPDYISAVLRSRSSKDIDVDLQFFFTGIANPTEKRYSISLQQDVRVILTIPVTLV